MTLSHDRKLVASCSPDDIVKIMDVSHFKDRPTDGSFDIEAYEATLEHAENHGKIEQPQKKKEEGDDWSDDSDDNDSDNEVIDCSDSSDSDDSMDAAENKMHKKRNKKLNQKQNTVGQSKKMIQQQKAKDFFKDM